MPSQPIIIAGAGIVGLWQAVTLARRGHRVRLIERSREPFSNAASAFAGAMLAPFCEEESAEPVIRELGLRGMELWRQVYPATTMNGTLVVAGARDRSELVHFARLTDGHEPADAAKLDKLEPDLAGRFTSGLYYPGEGHVATLAAMQFLLDAARAAGAEVLFGRAFSPADAGSATVIDCRGLAVRDVLPDLRGVRGERLVIRSREIALRRPVRLLHPRHPLYVVPWGDGVHMVGATVIESDDAGPITVRSTLELLGVAYALHPAFGEAEIIDARAGVRPAFPDNIPKVIVRGRTLHVNGMYRHGFLLAPTLAELVADYFDGKLRDDRLLVREAA